jgi:hypothetical protein
VLATPLKLVHYWWLCCNYYQRAQKWNNAPVWGITSNDFFFVCWPQDSQLLCFHIIQYKSERIIVECQFSLWFHQSRKCICKG